MSTDFFHDDFCVAEYESNENLAEVFFKRATGQLPEMECSKAIAGIVAEGIKSGDSILDVGCGVGHYLRSFKRLVSVPFSYVGIDYFPIFLSKAKEAWKNEPDVCFRQGSIFELPAADKEFDIVVCSNLFMHLPSIVKPVSELIRVGKRKIIIRTMIGERSFRIQEVYNSKWWPYTDVSANDEFKDNGCPRAYSFENIYSQDYFTSVIQRFIPRARIEYRQDNQFVAQNIQQSAETEGSVNATRIIDGKQVFGYIILPYHFVLVDLESRN